MYVLSKMRNSRGEYLGENVFAFACFDSIHSMGCICVCSVRVCVLNYVTSPNDIIAWRHGFFALFNKRTRFCLALSTEDISKLCDIWK